MPNSGLTVQNNASTAAEIDAIDVRGLVYIIRGKQVMIDSDLAMLYRVETKSLNRAASRNIERFPDDFRFQLTKEEYASLRFQSGTSSLEESHGGRRYLPYAYTEQGISMLASVLHSEVAVNVSISIMRTFVEMRRFISNNAVLFERIGSMELKQLEYQKDTDEKFAQVFAYINDHAESNQKIFFDGQIYDAHSFLIGLIQQAAFDIKLIDGYASVETLDMLSKKKAGVAVTIYTFPSAQLSTHDINTFNAQYPTLQVKKTSVFHDRFLILDNAIVYLIGASFKDAGKKCFGVSLLNEQDVVAGLLQKVGSI